MSHDHLTRPTAGDTLYETFVSGAIGGSVLAFFFLAKDLLAGQPLFTPSLLGSVLFFGEPASSVTEVRLDAVALMSAVHLVAFGILGYVSSVLVRRVEALTDGSQIMPAIALFLVLQGSFMVASVTVVPGVGAELGQGMVLMAHGLAAISMTVFLRHAHATGAPKEPERLETLERAPHEGV